MKITCLFIRSLIFNILYIPIIILYPAIGAIFSFMMTNKARHNFITMPAHSFNVLLRLVCGIKLEVTGLEHLPKDTNFVVLAKHQSDWETYYLQRLFRPVSTILKKELLDIPFFGWGLKRLHPIAIDRSNPREAMKQIMSQGKQRIEEGNNIVIYPEGTRMEFGERGKYARSGAALAIATGRPVVPLAHNAGAHWPGKKFIKYPGTIKVVIGKPIDTTDRKSKDLTNQVEEWIEAQQETFNT